MFDSFLALSPFADLFPWSGGFSCWPWGDPTPDTVVVNRNADPPVYTAQVGALGPEGLALVLTNANLLPAADGSALDFSTVTTASFAYVTETGVTGTWTATMSAVTADGATATHLWLANDIAEGRYRVIVQLTFPGGVRRTGWFDLRVTA